MYDQQVKDCFIELRSLGFSFAKISVELGISRPTLQEWGKEFADEIADLRVLHRENVREKLLGDHEQWCSRLVAHFNKLDEEFGRRKLQYSPTESVFRMMLEARRVLSKELLDDPPSKRSDNQEPTREEQIP